MRAGQSQTRPLFIRTLGGVHCKRPILTYPIGKAPLGSFPLKVFKNRT